MGIRGGLEAATPGWALPRGAEREEDWEERGLFQYPVIMASCFHSLFNKPLSLSLSPLASLFFIFLSQQIHLNAILFLKRPSHACLMNVREMLLQWC